MRDAILEGSGNFSVVTAQLSEVIEECIIQVQWQSVISRMTRNRCTRSVWMIRVAPYICCLQ